MKIIAHRGNNKNKNENRIEGLLKCLKEPYIDGVEFDIQMTKDCKFLLSHSNFLKTKDGEIFAISRNRLCELKKHSYEKNKKNYPLVTLEQFLRKVNGNKILLMELKVEGQEKEYAYYLKKILKKFPFLNLWICSFDPSILLFFKKDYPIGLIKTRMINEKKNLNDFDFVSSKEKEKIPYFLWTINKKICFPEDKNFLGIITDSAMDFQ